MNGATGHVSAELSSSPRCSDDSAGRYRIVTEVDAQQWNEFVLRHPHGNIFQSPHMYEVYRGARNHSPFASFAVECSTGRLCGVLSSVVVRELSGPFSRLSARAIIQGGPLVAPGLEDVLIPPLLRTHDGIVGGRALYSEVRNLSGVDPAHYAAERYAWNGHVNLFADLNNSEEQLWNAMTSRRRRSVCRSSRIGVCVRELAPDESLEDFYKMLRATCSRARVPLADISLFESARSVLMPGGLARFVVASLEDRVIACKVLLVYRGIAHAWYAGSTRSGLSSYPNDLLGWDAVLWSKWHGCVLFDFGGGGHPDVDYGPREFKKQFGGQEVNYGRLVKTHAPILAAISRIGFGVYRRVAYRRQSPGTAESGVLARRL